MQSTRRALAILLLPLLVLVGAAGCTPESTRERGGGPGGDVGNWGQPVTMHGEALPVEHIYWDTPLMGRGIDTAGSSGALQPFIP
jgi:hypothetical protein